MADSPVPAIRVSHPSRRRYVCRFLARTSWSSTIRIFPGLDTIVPLLLWGAEGHVQGWVAPRAPRIFALSQEEQHIACHPRTQPHAATHRFGKLANNSAAQSTNARTLALRCRFGGYTTWMGIGGRDHSGSTRTNCPDAR